MPRDDSTILILIVDDEPAVRTFLANALEARSYDFVLAEDGERGLALFLQCRDVLSLVLTDVSMPCMSGPKMVAEIRKFDEHIPIIFMTGYNPVQVIPADFHACPCLKKPFTTTTLFDAIHRCLETSKD